MKLLRLIAASFAALCSLEGVAAGVKGDVYFLGVALNQEGAVGHWEQVGNAGDWQRTIATAVLREKLYTVESSGVLYVTDLASGKWKPIGKPEFVDTKFMVSAGPNLYTIETSGTLYRVNPEDGSWQPVGKGGKWKKAIAATSLDGRIYTIESGGQLHAADPRNGRWRQIGRPEFAGTRFLFAARSSLYTIETDGSLYEVSPTDGTWARIGAGAAWKHAFADAILNDQLYTVEKDGRIHCTDPRTGQRRSVGAAEFGNTRFIFPSGEHLYTIEDGGLYRIKAKPGLKIGEWDWCAHEMERLWQTQGAGLSRGFKARKIVGNAATKAAIIDAFQWLEQKAGPDDLAVLYIGAHGETDPQSGWAMDTADLDRLSGAEVKKALARVQSRVLVFIETCQSGGFAVAHPKGDPPVPPNVTAFCACAATESTGNPLDIAVSEALYGRADFNRDDLIDLDELIQYVGQRYKERWPERGEGSNTPVIVRSPQMRDPLALTRPSKALSAVVVKRQLHSALNEGVQGDLIKIRVLGWSNRPGDSYFIASTATRGQMCLETDGPPLLVEQLGDWLPARLIKTDGQNLTARLLGKRPREVTVKAEQVRHPFVGSPR